MKRQLVFVAGLSLIFGVSIGYFVSLGSSFKKSADAMPALASALSKTDDFSDLDMAVIVRMFGLSETGKSAHTDRAAIWRLAKYYNQRSNLTTEEQEALGFSVISPKILKLQESNSSLRDAIAAGQSGGSKSNTQKSNKAVEATR